MNRKNDRQHRHNTQNENMGDLICFCVQKYLDLAFSNKVISTMLRYLTIMIISRAYNSNIARTSFAQECVTRKSHSTWDMACNKQAVSMT